MKLPVLLAFLALLLQDATADGKRWWRHVEYLASDELEGRNVGTPGFEKAMAYVEAQFKEAGLKPGAAAGYRQPVGLESRSIVPDGTRIALIRNGEEQPLVFREEATITPRGELDGTLEAPLVFVGYGLSVPDAKWDEFAGQDLRGKIAAYVNAPAPLDVSDNVKSHVTSAVERWAALRKAGAIGGLTLPAPRAAAANAPEPTPPPPPPVFVLADPELQDYAGLKVMGSVTTRGAEKLLAGSGHTLAELHQLVADKKPLPRFALPGALRVAAALKRDPIDSANIVGLYEGSDARLKNEYVVMTAHLDHVGVGRAVNGDNIYNGAMDDASGVASMIEIARRLKETNAKPKRSILFVAVTAEEKGLLGSRYFATRPTVPDGSIVANINLDMFLPLYPLKVIEVQGLAESTLGDAVRDVAKAQGVEVQADREPEQNRFIRSDQYSFIKRGIPALAFKFGYEFGSPEEKTRLEWVRSVYHKPNDDLSQPVDLEAAAKFNQVIAALLQRVADAAARPRWHDNSFFKRFAPGSTPQ